MDPSCFGCGFSVQVVGSFGFLCNPDRFSVVALLSVPGLRHVGAQDLDVI
jgi:hypothetical protein